MKYFANKFAKRCGGCGVRVEVGEGYTFNDGAWKTTCKSSLCLDKVGLVIDTKKYITDQGEIYMPYDPEALPILRGMPGARFDRAKKSWVVSIEPKDRARVLEGARRLGLTIPKGFDVLEMSEEVKVAIRRAKSAGAYDYQLEGVKFLSERDRALLADDMGLGKTFQSLNAVEGRAIVLCPASLKSNWASEVKKWRSDLTPVICKGRKGFKLPADGEVVIINYDIIPQEFKSEDDVPESWKPALAETTLISDEAHLCKSYKAARSQRTAVLSRMCGKSWAMTGTPLLSKGFDLWGVVETFGMGYEIFGGFKGFLRSMNAYRDAWGGWKFGVPDPSVPEKLRRVMLRRLKTEVLTELPPKTYQDILVDISSKKLIKLADEALVALGGDAVSELPPFEQFSEIRAQLAEDRIPALLELVESFEESEEPVVVFSAYRKPIDTFLDRNGWGVITGETSVEDRQMYVDLFQAGQLKGIACTIKAGGVGLTLTKASKMIFCDLEWNPALNAQAEDRICRIGQTAQSLQYIRLVSDCAMDRRVLQILDEKARLITSAVEAEVACLEGASLVVQETEAEQQARIAEDATKEINASARVCQAPSIPLTEEQKDAVKGALLNLLMICDGAKSEDEMGFNATDAHLARLIARSGLIETDIQVQNATWDMLKKYKGQIGQTYPILFK